MPSVFDGMGTLSNGVRHISAGEASLAIERGALLVDVREEYHAMMRTFGVRNCIRTPLSTLDDNLQNLPADVPLIIADATGLKSKLAVEKILNAGFTQVVNLAGGIQDWEREGYPVQSKTGKMLSGACPCMLKPM